MEPNVHLRPVFLVERYLPGLDEAGLRALGGRLASATAELRARRVEVRWLGSLALPAEETTFCRFAAGSREAVRLANELAAVPFERIVRALGVEAELRGTRPPGPASTAGGRTRRRAPAERP
jgi:Protein of unknown function (DUF4242)